MARFDFFKKQLPGGLLVYLMLLAVLLAGCQWIKPLQWQKHGENPRDVVTIFFSKYQGSQAIVEPVKRSVPDASQTDPLPFALQELLKGPTDEERAAGFYTEIPKGTQLRGIEQRDGKVIVDLSRQFEAGGGSNSMVQRLEELKRTTYSVDSQHQLEVLVEGKPLETLGGEGLEVPGTLKREAQ
jgi:spore germination protein GerM